MRVICYASDKEYDEYDRRTSELSKRNRPLSLRLGLT